MWLTPYPTSQWQCCVQMNETNRVIPVSGYCILNKPCIYYKRVWNKYFICNINACMWQKPCIPSWTIACRKQLWICMVGYFCHAVALYSPSRLIPWKRDTHYCAKSQEHLSTFPMFRQCNMCHMFCYIYLPMYTLKMKHPKWKHLRINSNIWFFFMKNSTEHWIYLLK